MDYEAVISGLLAECDLSSETGRKAAYVRCEEYADTHIPGRLEYNAFMEAVAVRLNLPAVRRNSLDEEDGESPENAKMHLAYTPKVGPELTANAEGLQYLASMLTELARQAVEHDHLHLYADELPMVGRTFPLTVYHEPDAWFERLIAEEKAAAGEKGKQPPAVAKRTIEPSEIAGLCLLSEVPPDMPLTKHRLYRVLSVDPYDGRKVWVKSIREGKERLCLFTVSVNGKPQAFGFDLDDPEVLFFSRQDVESLV